MNHSNSMENAVSDYTFPNTDNRHTASQKTAQKKRTVKLPQDRGTSVLIWGIIGFVLSFVPIAGIVFAIVAKVKARSKSKQCNQTAVRLRTGNILATLAIPLSILSTIVGAIIGVIVLISIIVEIILAILTFVGSALSAIVGTILSILAAIASIVGPLASLAGYFSEFAGVLQTLASLFG